MQTEIDYNNKNILAPMVRCGTLAYRLLALEYGADIVYSEEIIDYKMINTKRIVNETFNTIDYCVDGIEKPVFQTCEKEKGKVVFQIGTCNAERALKVAKLIEEDVAAIDINMGCPKEFSVQGGMGCSLLRKPDTIKEILTTLVNGCSKPITCKIRCLPSLEETLDLCKMIESCGVRAIAVHGRFQHERSKQPCHDDYIREIAKTLKIPVIANGGSNVIKEYADIEKFRESCMACSVMLARVAMWNCSIFRKEGQLPLDDAVKRFLQICLETNNFFYNTKYVVQQMLHEELQTDRGIAVLASMCAEEIYELFDMLDVYNEFQSTIKKKHEHEILMVKRKIDESKVNEENLNDELKADKIKKLKSDSHVVCLPAKFQKKDFRDGTVTPKSILHTFTIENDLPRPVYRTEEKNPERVYKSVVEVNKVLYTTPQWEPSKQLTEQAAAIVCLEILGVDYKSKMTSTNKNIQNNNNKKT